MEHLGNPFVERAIFAGMFKRRSRVLINTIDKYDGEYGQVVSTRDMGNSVNEVVLNSDPVGEISMPFDDCELKPARKRKK